MGSRTEHNSMSRADFMKAMSAGVLATAFLGGAAGNAFGSPSPRTVQIQIALDSVSALSRNTLTDNLYLFDSNRAQGSTGLGTTNLSTAVSEGDTIIWFLTGIEVETYQAIKSFAGPISSVVTPVEKFWYGNAYWEATVGPGSGTYTYTLDIKVESKLMTLDAGPSLRVLTS